MNEFSNLIEYICWHLENDEAVYINIFHDENSIYFGSVQNDTINEECQLPYTGSFDAFWEDLNQALTSYFGKTYPLIMGMPNSTLSYTLVISGMVFVNFPCDNQAWIQAQAHKKDLFLINDEAITR